MSVTEAVHHWNGTTGSRELGKQQYTAVWKVTTDTVNDQTATICDHFKNAGNLPYLGSAYSYRNDSDSAATCTKIDPRREPKSHFQWEVVLTYSTPQSDEKEEKPDNNGNPTTDPALWIDRLDISFRSIMVPCEQAIYRGGFKAGGGAAMLTPDGKVMIPCNSALVPCVPGLEQEVFISVVRKQWNSGLAFQQAIADSFIGRVNSEAINVNVQFLKYVAAWPKFTVRIADYGGSPELINGKVVWVKRVEAHINPLGWRRQVIDRGLHASAFPGDPDGRGGTLSASDVPTGAAPMRRIEDAQGFPVREPVLLDGKGQPLVTNVNFPDTVYITYQVDQEIQIPDFIGGRLE